VPQAVYLRPLSTPNCLYFFSPCPQTPSPPPLIETRAVEISQQIKPTTTRLLLPNMPLISKITHSNYHMCDWCGSPHMTEQCYRRDPRNVFRFPLPEWQGGIPPASILAKYRKPQPKDPNWYRARYVGFRVPSTTGALIRALSTLQTLSDMVHTRWPHP
jgi:hypothetical protein